MISSLYLLAAVATIGMCFAGSVGKAKQQEEESARVARSLGQASPKFFDPQAEQMVDWNSIYNKRAFDALAKRQLGAGGAGVQLGQPSPNSLNFQDWSSTFGRNYRSFGNHIPTLGEHANLRPVELQDWKNFFGRHSKRFSDKRVLGNSQDPGFDWDMRPSNLQNWRAFFSTHNRNYKR